MKVTQAVVALVLIVMFSGCATSPNERIGSSRKKTGHLVTFEVFACQSTNLSGKTQIFLITDGTVSSTRIKSMEKRVEGVVTIYSGSLQTYSGQKRYLVVQPPKEPALVFVLTTQVTPRGLEWVPCPRPDFVEKSDEPAWNLSNDINTDQRSNDLPSITPKLRYNITERGSI
jgi:hypothetical protein